MFEILGRRSSTHINFHDNTAVLQFIARDKYGKMVANIYTTAEECGKENAFELAEPLARHKFRALFAQTERTVRRLKQRGMSIRRFEAVK